MKILYFDTETTGLSPKGGYAYGQAYLGKICQLAYIIEEDGAFTAKNFYFAVEYVETGAKAVNGLNPRLLYELSGGREFSDDSEEIGRDFAEADVIVAHNFSFDHKFMEAEFSRINREFVYKRSFCTMRGCTSFLQLPPSRGKCFRAPSLAILAEFFKVSEEEVNEMNLRLFGARSDAHDARYDTVKLALSCIKGREICPNMIEAFN